MKVDHSGLLTASLLWFQNAIPAAVRQQPSSVCSLTRTFATKNRSQSSNKWIQRHENDPYVKRARQDGEPSRAIYKLEEIDDMACKFLSAKRKEPIKKSIFQPGFTVLDLGAAPGGWSKYASKKIQSNGLLIAVDLLSLDPRTVSAIQADNTTMPSFEFLQGDFTSEQMKQKIVNVISQTKSNQKVNVVMSDMAHNTMGHKHIDAIRTMNLCLDAIAMAAGPDCFTDSDPIHDNVGVDISPEAEIKSLSSGGILKRGGYFLCKYFACGQKDEYDLMSATKRNFEYTTILKPKASRKESNEMYLFAAGYKGGSRAGGGNI